MRDGAVRPFGSLWVISISVSAFENHTCHGSRGDVLFYPGGHSETEFLFVYGSSSFASKMGSIAGNHFLTLVEGHEYLQEFGKRVLWEGAQDIRFSLSN